MSQVDEAAFYVYEPLQALIRLPWVVVGRLILSIAAFRSGTKRIGKVGCSPETHPEPYKHRHHVHLEAQTSIFPTDNCSFSLTPTQRDETY